MSMISTNNKTSEWKCFIFSTLSAGFGMWVIGGLYHNLILPSINKNILPHHDGLGITLIAYFILALMMTYFISNTNSKTGSLFHGGKLGIIIGILWVFPHGLAMAGTHQTSITYEIKNTLYHMIEQGLGGVIIAFVFNYCKQKNG